MTWTKMIHCTACSCGSNDWTIIDGTWHCAAGHQMSVVSMEQRPGEERLK